jgi:DNA polymerase/3'-5' exonuclease PolX
MTELKEAIIRELSVLQKTCASEQAGIHKARQYATAIKTIRAIPYIHTIADVPTGKGTGIGDKIYEKIKEIIDTGHLGAADRARESKAPDSLEVFRNIYGVGPKKAADFVAAGYRTLNDLRKAASEDNKILTKNMRVGLLHYDDFLTRIPRTEMEKHEEMLLLNKPVTMTGIIVGSYRRGRPDSGDIDMLCSCAPGSDTSIKGFVTILKACKYITDVLAQGDMKCLAVCRLPGKPYRRLDLLLTPPEEFPFAVLYFTGSDGFNVRMRQRALEKGYTLNEHALTHIATKTKVAGIRTEADIFRTLNIVYKEPSERTGPEAIISS